MTGKSAALASALALLLCHPASAFDSQGGPSVIDPRDSRFCLGCHDGTVGPNVITEDMRVTRSDFQGYTPDNFALEHNHPIGIYYPTAQLRSLGRLKDPSQLDPAVKLRDGHVTCSSCHDQNSQLPKKLVMQNTGSRLCLSCHNL